MFGDKEFDGVGYPTPSSVPVDRGCRSAMIPADAAWYAVFMGALEPLTRPEAWQQYEGGISREDAACYFQEIVDSLYQSAEDGGCVSECCPIFNTDPATGLPQVSYDGGLTYTKFPQGEYVPGEDTPYAPNPPPLGKGSEDADKCQAAANAALVLANFYEQTAGEAAAGLYNTVLNVNKFLYQLNQSLLRLIYPSEAQIAQALGFFDFDWPTYADAPTLSDDQIGALQCLLLENAVYTSGIVTFDFDAVRDNLIGTLGTNPGVALTLLADYIQQPGLDAAGGVNVATGADCSDCGTWCHIFDLTVSTAGVTVVSGTFSSGNGIVPANVSGQRQAAVKLVMPTLAPGSAITQMRYGVNYVTGGSGSTGLALFVNNFTGSYATIPVPIGISEPVGNPGSYTATDVDPIFVVGHNNGAGYLRSIILEGTGVNPYGSDNC